MALDGCGLFCKYILIIFNIIFAVVGFAFLGLGLWLRFSNDTRGIFEIEALSSTTFVTAVTVLIILGTVMLVVVVFGDYGACNEKRCALQVFSVLLALLAGAAVAVGVITYSKKDEVGLHIADFYSSMYALYVSNGDPVVRVTLTFIHMMLHCCGLTGVPLVEIAAETCPKPQGIFEHIVMPSCPGIIMSTFDSRAPLVMGILIGTGALLVVALICTIILLKQVKEVQQDVAAYYRTVY
ncbi:CD9 antigen isoform X2 [Xyrichtys novacula]|uniref:Tetraspanin n=2 Tax=Xyrichtys novacula TaxID=13765 RepID=A0AAV1GRC8_XYRNO|nr:CD9 antigen isoform X2 [Xyrichtys novacula]